MLGRKATVLEESFYSEKKGSRPKAKATHFKDPDPERLV